MRTESISVPTRRTSSLPKKTRDAATSITFLQSTIAVVMAQSERNHYFSSWWGKWPYLSFQLLSAVLSSTLLWTSFTFTDDSEETVSADDSSPKLSAWSMICISAEVNPCEMRIPSFGCVSLSCWQVGEEVLVAGSLAFGYGCCRPCGMICSRSPLNTLIGPMPG